MRNYIILNGVNSNTITGLLISTLPPITKPKQRTTVEEIDGRDGDIVTKLGYSAYDKEFEIGLYGNFDINEVISYFNSEGTVVFSNENDKYYNYQILDQIDYEKLIRFKTATIRMHVQPFKYPLEEEQIQVDATVIEAEGSNISLQYTNPNHTITSELKGNLYQETTTGKNLFGYGITAVDNTASYRPSQYQRLLLSATANPNEVKFNYNGTYCFGYIEINGIDGTLPYSISFNIKENTTNYTPAVVVDTTNSTNQKLVIIINGNNKGTSTSSRNYFILTNIQVESGSTLTQYEPYTNGASPNPDYPQEIEVVTGQQEINIVGKNRFDKSNITFYANDTSTFIPSTSDTNNTRERTTSFSVLKSGIKANTTYKVSGMPTGWKLLGVGTFTSYGGTNTSQSSTNINNGTFSITSSAVEYIYLLFRNDSSTAVATELFNNANMQIEEGTEATDYDLFHSQSYTIDLGTTELCKIGNYKDRIYPLNGKWYLNKQIGKITYDGTEYWGLSNNVFYKSNSTILQHGNIKSAKSNYFQEAYNQGSTSNVNTYNPDNSICGSAEGSNRIYIKCTSITSIDNFKTWLSTHNTTVYYILNTPTTEEITDTTLLGQLNELAGATTYENTTNISVTGSLPVILKANTSGMPNTVINNIGNIYAKPLITIYGSGTIGVYLNQIQVLQIELGNNGSITIDVSKMEAYNNSTKALMNRLVTGDYMKFLINSGENNIAFSGNVAGFTMDNYTRWL